MYKLISFIIIVLLSALIVNNCYSDAPNKTAEKSELSCDEIFKKAKDLVSTASSQKPEPFDYNNYSDDLQNINSFIEKNMKKCSDNINMNILMAEIKMKIGCNEEALQYARDALLLDINDATANYTLGEIFIQMKNYDEGIAYIEKAISFAPNNIYFLFNYCGYLDAAGRHEDTIKACTKVIESDAVEVKFKGYIFYTRARAYEALGNIDSARNDYEKGKRLGYGRTGG